MAIGRSRMIILLSLALIPLLEGCIPKKKATSSTKSDTAASSGLDINDVSILLPLPKTSTEVPQMLPMGFTNAAGKTPMTSELFKSILARHDTKQEVEGKVQNLQSGGKFTGTQRMVATNPRSTDSRFDPTAFGPYDRLEDWKIVAMRFDTCAPVPSKHGLSRDSLDAATNYDPNECLIQMRLTAQPIIRDSFDQARNPSAEDFAIHMIFNLSLDEGRTLYNDLVSFRDGCGDITASLPLMPHPCLALEYNKQGFGGPKFKIFEDIIKKHANTNNFAALAMMASGDGDDPWAFMNGAIVNGAFVHLVIEAVHKTDPATIRRGQNGNMLEPFLNGYFQQLDFLSIGGSGMSETDPIKVYPQPVPSKVKDFLLTEYTGVKGDLGEIRVKLNAIENPLINNFFSTDCLSCHAASAIGYFVAKRESGEIYKKNQPEIDGPSWATKGLSVNKETHDPAVDDLARKSWLPASRPKGFSIPGPYIQLVEPATRTQGTTREGEEKPTALMHFAYLSTGAQISQRTVNESALAAKQANKLFANGNEPAATCPREEFESCLAAPYQGSHGSVFQMLSYCTQVHCPQKAKQLEPLFGKKAVKAYKLVKPIEVDKDRRAQPEDRATLELGSVIWGTWDSWMPGSSWFTPMQDIKFVNLKNEVMYAPRFDDFEFVGKWQDFFEEVGADKPAATETPICRDASSDRDGHGVEDGWGFEDGRSCRVKK